MTPKYLSPDQVEHFYPGLSRQRLERWRWAKTGPAYVKAGRQILYSHDDLEAFLASSRTEVSHAE